MTGKETIDGYPEPPVVLARIEQDDGTSLYRFAFEGKPYEMTGPSMEESSFTDWLPEYASKTPRCACCERVIFPGQPVTLGTVNPGDTGYSHYSTACNDTAGGFAGAFNAEGVLTALFAA